MTPKLKKQIIFSLKIALVAALLTYLFYDVARDGKLSELIAAPKRWGWVGFGLLACFMAHLIGFVRWQLMVKALGLPFSVLDSIRIGLIGLFFGLFAFGVVGGDTLRAFYVTRQIKNRVSEAITSVLADRLIGILTMFMIASIALLSLDGEAMQEAHGKKATSLLYVGYFVVGCTCCGISGLVVLFFTPRLINTNLFQRLIKIPKFGELLEKLTGVIQLYRQRLGTIAVAFVMSVGVNICFAAAIYSFAEGLTQGNPTFLEHFTIEPIAMVSNAVPVPGGIGTMEMAMKFLYLAFGSENGVVTAFAFRFSLLTVAALGGLFWFLNREQVNQIELPDEKISDEIESATEKSMATE